MGSLVDDFEMEGCNSENSIVVEQISAASEVIFTPAVTVPATGHIRQHSETGTAPATGTITQHLASPNQRENTNTVRQQLTNQ